MTTYLCEFKKKRAVKTPLALALKAVLITPLLLRASIDAFQ
jgi:hypothetical protein